jgi:ATP-binding cassette, subfamily B, bacterial MsbA
MKYFRRVLGYMRGEIKAVIIAFVCALLVAALLSLSLAAMLPLMKVLVGEEGLPGWVYSGMIKHRCGIDFEPIPLGEYLDKSPIGQSDDSSLLRVGGVIGKSAAYKAGVRRGDEVIAVQCPGDPRPQTLSRNALLEKLAQAPADEPIVLTVLHPYRKAVKKTDKEILESRTPENYKLTLENPLKYRLYVKPAQWFLNRLPPDTGPKFKRDSIINIIIVMVIVTFIRCVLRFIHEYLIDRVALHCTMMLRRKAYANAIRLPLSFFSTQGVSDIMSRFVQDSSRINTAITTTIGKVVREPFIMIFLAIYAFSINSRLTLIVMMIAPVAGLLLLSLGRKMKRSTKKSLKSWAEMLSRLQQSLFGVRVVKGYHREEFEQQRFDQVNLKLFKQQCRIQKIDNANNPLMEFLGTLAASAGMIFAASLMAEGKLPISDFTALIIALAMIVESGRKMGDVWPRLQTANAAAERVFKVVDAPAEHDPPNAVELPRLSKTLEFKDISFSYPKTLQPAVDNVSLTVNAGETVAIVGPNGSGKTTLLSLIPRFFIADRGSILFDGLDTAQAALGSLRRQIGLVTQHIIVFNDSIAANIAYGNLDATQDQIVAAAKQAFAHEFIEETADGYQTIVGENGVTLSGGQLQRICIARAILRDPAILIFDEAMSQIDADSEAKIQQAIETFTQGRTSFLIAHRLSTIIHADRIVVMDRGQVVAQGTHQQLLAESPLYRQLYEGQFFGQTES